MARSTAKRPPASGSARARCRAALRGGEGSAATVAGIGCSFRRRISTTKIAGGASFKTRLAGERTVARIKDDTLGVATLQALERWKRQQAGRSVPIRSPCSACTLAPRQGTRPCHGRPPITAITCPPQTRPAGPTTLRRCTSLSDASRNSDRSAYSHATRATRSSISHGGDRVRAGRNWRGARQQRVRARSEQKPRPGPLHCRTGPCSRTAAGGVPVVCVDLNSAARDLVPTSRSAPPPNGTALGRQIGASG